MVEKVYSFYTGNDKVIEKIIMDENLHYMHMVFNKNEGLSEHFSNSNVYMTVLRGTLSIALDEQEVHEYNAGTLLKIPFQTKMNVKNYNSETLEIIIVKAPAPKGWKSEGWFWNCKNKGGWEMSMYGEFTFTINSSTLNCWFCMAEIPDKVSWEEFYTFLKCTLI